MTAIQSRCAHSREERTTSPSPHDRRTARRLVSSLVAIAVAIATARDAGAAKWRHCPETLAYHPSRIGAVSAPFVHPGHELGIFLSAQDISGTGGFSTAPGGNTVWITFASLFGAPVTLPTFTVAAVSPATLYFTFPDTRALLGGRVLAGPVSIAVTTGDQLTADILPRHLVALPPPTDVGALVGGAVSQGALATMDTRGAIWIPVQFSSFGTMQKNMPTCPSTFTPLTALAVGVTVRAMPSFVTDAPPTYPPFRSLRRADVFLGDFLVNGNNMYGMAVGDVHVFRVPRGWGIEVCALNDAVDLVLRAPGYARWAKPYSPFGEWMPDSRALDIQLAQVAANLDPSTKSLDAFGSECVLP